MKNNILVILLIFYQILFFNKLFAKEIKFDASDIEINKGQNLTIANNGIAKIKDDGIIVEGIKIKYFKDQDYLLCKRAEILGTITQNLECLAIAGTHGKTTISSLLAYILSDNLLFSSQH